MLPIRCFTCGHIFADIELEYEEKMQEIENDMKLTQDEKAQAKRDLVDKLMPDRFKLRYCCRARLISYVDEIKVVI